MTGDHTQNDPSDIHLLLHTLLPVDTVSILPKNKHTQVNSNSSKHKRFSAM